MQGYHKKVLSDSIKTQMILLEKPICKERQIAGLLKDRYFWYIAVLVIFAGTFAYAPEIAALIRSSTSEGWELAYYVAIYRVLFLLSVALSAWRFGVTGGLIVCFTFAPITFSIIILNLWEPNKLLDIGLIIIGITFSWLIGRQGKLRRLLEQRTGELEQQAAKMNLEITERKRVEEEIRKSEERYRLLAENVTDVIWKVNMDSPTQLTYISPSVTQLLGYTVEEAMDNSMDEVFTPASFRSAMKALTEETAGEQNEHVDQHRSRMLELELKHKDGSIIAAEANYTFIRDSKGQPVEILAVARDITKRKRMEENIRQAAEEWRRTFDSTSDAISIHSKDRRILRVNKAFAGIFHMKPQQLIGKHCYEVMHGTKEPVPACPLKQMLVTKKPAAAEFYEPHLGIYLQHSASPIFNEKGEVVSTVNITRDITERRRHEEQLMITDRLASIGELVSGVAHELNNPLTSVIGFSQLLMERDVADDMKADLGLVNSEAQRCASIVKNLLTFARKHTPVKQLSQVNNIIDDMLRLRAYEQKVNNIEVKKRFATDLPEIMVDYFQMQQVFLNIIINAEYFMIQANNKGILTIATKRLDDIVRISIVDDGPGIPKENLGRIFDPFFTTKEVGKGTGLGLSICHGIVSEHGGRIYARNELGKGATFVIELPIDGS